MQDMIPESQTRPESTRGTKKPFVPALFVGYVFELFGAAMKRNAGIIAREADIFFGSALLSIGLLGFESSKYCDGNTAEYLSCTRPSTYYYYDALDIVLVILGISFILFWFFKREHHKR